MIRKQSLYYVVFVGFLSTITVANGQIYSTPSCTPFPSVVPTPNTYNIGEMLTAGPWYGYMIYNSADPLARSTPDANVASYYTSLGKVPEPTRNQQAEIMIQEKRRVINGSCASSLVIAHVTSDGRQFGPVFAGINAQGVNAPSGYDSSTIWSTDQSTYIMYLWCLKYNWETGTCASTRIYVYTRTKPTDMSAYQKQVINDAVDAVLKPYCLKSSQFAQYQSDSYMPDCPAAPRPECFNQVLTAYRRILTNQL